MGCGEQMNRIREYMKDHSRLHDLSPILLLVMADLIVWGIERGIPIMITDTVSDLNEDAALERVSSTHREGRAFDVSAKGWTTEQIEECVRSFSFKYRNIAALSKHGDPRLVYVHDAGTGKHLHFQINRKYAMGLKFYASPESL